MRNKWLKKRDRFCQKLYRLRKLWNRYWNYETDTEKVFTFEEVECIGACGGAPAVQVNYETVEGLTPEKSLQMCEWLKEERPEIIVAEELQEKFGGVKSFDWAIKDNTGSSYSVPGFQNIGTAKEKS